MRRTVRNLILDMARGQLSPAKLEKSEINEGRESRTSSMATTQEAQLKAILQSNNKDSLYLTVKKYNNKYGLSMFIHHAIGCVKEYGIRQKVEVRGPMGTGLDVQSAGTHVVFAAGTGILVFIDIVAHLILRILAVNGGPNMFRDEPEENLIDVNNFKLILHTSFATKEDAIGLDLMAALESLCRTYGYSDLF